VEPFISGVTATFGSYSFYSTQCRIQVEFSGMRDNISKIKDFRLAIMITRKIASMK
jgi:hypothetical protein